MFGDQTSKLLTVTAWCTSCGSTRKWEVSCQLGGGRRNAQEMWQGKSGKQQSDGFQQVAALNGHCSELADRGFVMLEQRLPTCVPRIHDQFPGDKCVHYSSSYFGKGKAVPLQAWTGPGGSRKLMFQYFVTTVHDAGRLSALRTGGLEPQEIPLVLISVTS